MGEVTRGDSVVVGLWYFKDSGINVDARCFFWCTPGGQVPQAPDNDGSMLEEEVVDRLVSRVSKLLFLKNWH